MQDGLSGPECLDPGRRADSFRFEPDGQLDSTFGTGGSAVYDYGFDHFQSSVIALQPDGAIVVATQRQWRPLMLRFQGDPPTVRCGDPNFSETVTASDALLALRSAVGIAECRACLCDTNGSDTTSAIDALLILRSATDKSVTLQCSPGC